jgi:hypothetical protein
LYNISWRIREYSNDDTPPTTASWTVQWSARFLTDLLEALTLLL